MIKNRQRQIYKPKSLEETMGTVAIKMKFMPESPEANLESIKDLIKEKLDREEVKGPKFEIEPVAFGLKAIILFFTWPEDKELEKFENELKEIKGIGSAEMLDMRRAIE